MSGMGNSERRLLAVLGRGVRDSLSPVMHNYLFKIYGMDHLYTWIDIPEKALKRFIDIARNLYVGLNVTIPFKEVILKYIDVLDDHARSIGAVNTISFTESSIYGYNTDYEAIYRALTDREASCYRSLIIGAGGSARAVLYALKLFGCEEIYILNRTFSKAYNLCREHGCVPLKVGDVWSINSVDLVASAVPSEAIYELKLIDGGDRNFLKALSPNIVVDLSYRPPCTRLLRESISMNIKIVDGLEILARQGAYAWRYWFGMKVDWEQLYRVILSESIKKYSRSCIDAISYRG